MKKILTLLCMLAGVYTAQAQYAFSTAWDIKKLGVVPAGQNPANLMLLECDAAQLKILHQLLMPYLTTAEQKKIVDAKDGAGIYDELTAALKNNPFFQMAPRQHFMKLGDDKSPGNIVKSLASQVGGLDVTNIADGLAKFLVERTKKELSITFFERFKKDLEDIKQLQILFPSTYKALQAIDDEIYNYAAYMDLLRESFQKDLALLLPNIKNLVEDPCMDQVFTAYPNVRTILTDGLYLVNAFIDGDHPGEVIHNYVTDQIDSIKMREINGYIYPSLQTLDLFSQSLRSKEGTQYWIGSDSLKFLYQDGIIFRLYMGLVYQNTAHHKIYFDKTTLDAQLTIAAAKFEELKKTYRPYINGIIEKGKTIDYYFQAIKDIQSAGKAKPTYQDYYSLYDASVNFLEHLVKGKTLLGLPELPKADNNIAKYFTTARGLGNIYVDVYEKQYTSAVVEFGSIYKLLVVSDYHKSKDSLDIKTVNDATKNAIKTRLQKLDFVKAQEKLVAIYVKYGGFAAEISKAETSDDVQKAIEAFALPTGSARIKRESPFNVSLNAYVGLYGGYERIKGIDPAYKNPLKDWNTYGITAPVGIAVNFGCHHWSHSIFVSLVDIGTIASFRFNSPDTVTQIPKVQLKDIVSPGVFYSLGIPKTPISINFGTQMGANLRKVVASTPTNPNPTNEYADKVYWRYSVSICVDIPLINLYTKSKD